MDMRAKLASFLLYRERALGLHPIRLKSAESFPPCLLVLTKTWVWRSSSRVVLFLVTISWEGVTLSVALPIRPIRIREM